MNQTTKRKATTKKITTLDIGGAAGPIILTKKLKQNERHLIIDTFGKDYKYEYGRCDILRKGSGLTIVASGATVNEALAAVEKMKKGTVELVIVSSPKKFDKKLFDSIEKTGHVLTVEDHNTHSGMGAMLARELQIKGVCPKKFKMLGVKEYQLSGTAQALYKAAGIDFEHILKTAKQILGK